MKKVEIDPKYADLMKIAKDNQLKRRNKSDNVSKGNYIHSFQIDEAATIEKKIICGCYGTMHDTINNCMNCGRVLCSAEGERPCPFCNTPVFSDETLKNPEKMNEMLEKFQKMYPQMSNTILTSNDLLQSQVIEEISTDMKDMDKDWFSVELENIYKEAELL